METLNDLKPWIRNPRTITPESGKQYRIPIGFVSGNLTVIGSFSKRGKMAYYPCNCKCGNISEVRGYDLLRQVESPRYKTISCGCERSLSVKEGRKTFGLNNQNGLSFSESRTYGIWRGMIRRCYDKTCRSFKDYGGRGIEVCERWRNNFLAFYEDMGKAPDGLSLERIKNDGNYELNNCRWATRQEQNTNTRKNRMITAFNETHTLSEWARKTGISANLLHARLGRLGWSPEKALSKPPTVALNVVCQGCL